MPSLQTLASIALLSRSASAAGGVLPVAWSLDKGITLGPDGPWQAIELHVGSNNATAYAWPSGSGITQVLSTDIGGNYSAGDSSTAVSYNTHLGNSDSWLSSPFLNESSLGVGYYDTLHLDGKLQPVPQLNASISSLFERKFQLPDGFDYTNPVGILGLGREEHAAEDKWILDQFKAHGAIASNTFSLHMGSAALNQTGSLVLGGYEANRAYGDVGSFEMNMGIPSVVLRDVFLGTEVGAAAFDADIVSVYQGLRDDQQAIAVSEGPGVPEGVAIAVPNPSTPYIHLPWGTCETAAKHLPVTWDDSLGLYLWDVQDPKYDQILASAAYMGFVLEDKYGANLTVKVPFQLLNLTLTPPLVETPTQYLPCKPTRTGYGIFQLGRAFLQSAFMFLNYETQTMMMAQGPGPNMGPSVLRAVEVEDRGLLETESINSWVDTWASIWGVSAGLDGPDELKL